MIQKNNSGSLYKNTKDKPTQPDYTGTATIAEKQYRISGWVNTSKAGTPYLRVLFTEQQSLDLNPSVVQTTAPMTPMSDNTEVVDDLPF